MLLIDSGWDGWNSVFVWNWSFSLCNDGRGELVCSSVLITFFPNQPMFQMFGNRPRGGCLYFTIVCVVRCVFCVCRSATHDTSGERAAPENGSTLYHSCRTLPHPHHILIARPVSCVFNNPLRMNPVLCACVEMSCCDGNVCKVRVY